MVYLIQRTKNKFYFECMSFTPVGITLQHKMNNDPTLKKQIASGNVVVLATEVFDRILGESFSQYGKVLFLKNRTLTITCRNNALAQEIRMAQLRIVDALNEKLGESLVDRIRYLS